MFINSFSALSPAGFLSLNSIDFQKPAGVNWFCQEPSYKDIIPPMQLRRMSKTLRMGMMAATSCMSQAGIAQPDGIHIGTAYGVLDDSEKFLERLLAQNEQTLTPTAFIQSTHNTVSGQIALSCNCHAHNMTFVHNGHSFESALLDAELLLKRNPGKVSLVGSVDELTATSAEVLKHFQASESNIRIGEGATFCVISENKNSKSIAEIASWTMFQENKSNIEENIAHFLQENNIDLESVDLWIVGNNLQTATQEKFEKIKARLDLNKPLENYKQYSGEFPTAAAFGLIYTLLMLRKTNKKQAIVINNFGKYWSVFFLKNSNLV